MKSFGQPQDYFASACRDSAKANLSVEARHTRNGTVFLHASNYTDLVVGSRRLPEAVETALALVKVGQRAEIHATSARMRDDVSRFPFGGALRDDVTWSVTCYNVTRPSKMSVAERMDAAVRTYIPLSAVPVHPFTQLLLRVGGNWRERMRAHVCACDLILPGGDMFFAALE